MKNHNFKEKHYLSIRKEAYYLFCARCKIIAKVYSYKYKNLNYPYQKFSINEYLQLIDNIVRPTNIGIPIIEDEVPFCDEILFEQLLK